MVTMLCSMRAFPATITFNEAVGSVAGFGPQQLGLNPQGTALTNQFTGLGVTFSNNGVLGGGLAAIGSIRLRKQKLSNR